MADRNVVSGERSSWLALEANRASRSIRCWRLATMRLKLEARAASSLSSPTSRRRSSCPSAIDAAVAPTSASGSRSRRLTHTPSPVAASIDTAAAVASENRRVRSVRSSSVFEKISK